MIDVRHRYPRAWRAATFGAAIALGVVAFRVLAGSSDQFGDAVGLLGHVRPAWVVVAIVTEVLSYVGYGAAQRALLRSAGYDVGIWPLTGACVAGQAASNCLPGGMAVSAVVMYRRLRRRGVPDAMSGWMLLLSGLLYAIALAALAVVGVQLARTDPVPGLREFSLGVVVVLLGLVVALWRARERLGRWRLVRRSPWLLGLAERLATVRMSSRAAAVAFGLLLLCWATDALALFAAYSAVDAHPPLRGLLLAYCAGQLAAAFPITPGGLGVTEGSLTVALVAFGGARVGTIAAVLLYRLVAFWAIIPAGGLAYLLLRRSERRLVPMTQPACPPESAPVRP